MHVYVRKREHVFLLKNLLIIQTYAPLAHNTYTTHTTHIQLTQHIYNSLNTYIIWEERCVGKLRKNMKTHHHRDDKDECITMV